MRNGPLLGGLVIVVIAVGLALYFTYDTTAPRPGSVASSTPVANTVTFYCGNGNTMQGTFAANTLTLTLDNGQRLTLPQVRSGSGIRYESTSTGADLVFIGKGDYGSFTNAASTTDVRYADCTAANVTPTAIAGYEQYENTAKTFAFTFPSAFSVAGIQPGYGPNWSAPATTTGMVLAKVTVPQSFEPGTNFGDAWFTVGVSSVPQAVTDCTKNLEGRQSTSTPVTINGTTYQKLLFTGVGAGNIYDTTSYRTVKDNECYAIEYTIHYGNIHNYPPGKVSAFNEQKVATVLDAIVQSFRFQ